jgi:hypothetical protein
VARAEKGRLMPALTMRGRYLMREYWSDSDLFLRLEAAERELYQGLWMLADDAGWMPRDVPAIAAALYRYEDRAPRERMVSNGLARLQKLGKVETHRCCLFLPAVSKYPRAGRKSNEHEVNHAEHQSKTKRSDRIQRETNPSPVPSLPDPSLPVVAPARAPEGAAATGPSLKDRVGWKVPA